MHCRLSLDTLQGFNELGYLGCTDTHTPRIDDIAINEGLILWHNYVSKICSPSRSAFLSGRYPSTLGLQNLVFNTQWPISLTRQVSILSEEFKANGYSTHLIGYGDYDLCSLWIYMLTPMMCVCWRRFPLFCQHTHWLQKRRPYYSTKCQRTQFETVYCSHCTVFRCIFSQCFTDEEPFHFVREANRWFVFHFN